MPTKLPFLFPCENMAASNFPHVAILASPGMGHLIPVAELAKSLSLRHNIHVTFIAQPLGGCFSAAEQDILAALPSQISAILIPPPNFPNINVADANKFVFQTINNNLPLLRDLLSSLASEIPPLTALVMDVIGVELLHTAVELGVRPYLFFTTSCMALSFFLRFPKIDAMFHGEFKDLPEPVQVPGCLPVHGRDFPEAVQVRGAMAHMPFLRYTRLYSEVKAILVNSFEELESEAVKGLQEDKGFPPVYPVGPVVRSGSAGSEDGKEWSEWLDRQPPSSVLYVCFGSAGVLSREQTKELGCALELSGVRFLWAFKGPSGGDGHVDLEIVDEGFLERIRDRGLLIASWAPQLQVLSHASIGGFLMHCGWNSTLESMINGVPLIAWPLHNEQKMNAMMLADGAKVALRPVPEEDGWVGRKEISRVVKCLMEGEQGKELSKRMTGFSEAAARAVSEGGSSSKFMAEVVQEWRELAQD